MTYTDVRRYQRRDSVPSILGPRSLPVPRTKTSHDTSQITTSQTRTSHFTHTHLYGVHKSIDADRRISPAHVRIGVKLPALKWM